MSQAIELYLDEQGQLLIPHTLQERLGLSPGMTLLVERGENHGLRLRIQPAPELVDKGGVLVVRAEAGGDLSEVTRRERDLRVLELTLRAE